MTAPMILALVVAAPPAERGEVLYRMTLLRAAPGRLMEVVAEVKAQKREALIAGLIPTAIGIGAGSAQRSAVAVTIIGGQMLCLLPTLLVTPVDYSLFAEAGGLSWRELLARVKTAFRPAREVPGQAD